jgi:hypothetical protein
MTTNQRLFMGVYPCGIVYADRKREVAGDYKRLAFLDYATLTLEIGRDCPNDLAGEIRKDASAIQARRGEQFQLSTSGQTITLGHGADNLAVEAYALGSKAFRNGRKCIPANDTALMALIEKHKNGQTFGWTIPIFRAWSRAWHAGNTFAKRAPRMLAGKG